MVWAAVGTAALGLVASNQQAQAAKAAANAQERATQAASEQAAFDPYDVNMQGLGSVEFDAEGNQVSTNLDPRVSGMAGNLYGRAEGYLGATPEAYRTNQDLYGLGTGALGAAGGFLQGAQQQQPQGFDLMQQGASQAQGLFGQAGAQDFGAGQGFLSQLNQFDPDQAAQTRFGQLESMLEPSRQKSREALESRLLKQGRLGSTGGSGQQGALEEAIGQQQMQNLLASTGESRAQQQQLLGMGQGLGQDAMARAQGLSGLGAQQGALYGNLGSQIQSAGQQAQMQQAGLFGQMGQFGAGLESMRGSEDYRQLQLEQAYQQAGTGALGAGMDVYGSAGNLINIGAGLGGRQASAGAVQGQLGMQGAQAGSAALLGGAAGQAAGLNAIGGALQYAGGSPNTGPAYHYGGAFDRDYGTTGVAIN